MSARRGAHPSAPSGRSSTCRSPCWRDVDHAVAEAYGSWVEKQNYGKTYWGTARRTFLVDPEGRIARVWPKVKPEGHAADVLAVLDELQAAHAS